MIGRKKPVRNKRKENSVRSGASKTAFLTARGQQRVISSPSEPSSQCGVDQLADRLAHNQEAVGSSPAPATISLLEGVRPAEDTVLKTGAGKSVRGSNPLPSAISPECRGRSDQPTAGGGFAAPAPTSESTLQEAERIINGPRRASYGPAIESFKRIATVWNVTLYKNLKTPITGHQVALCMIGLKLCREVNSPARDNRVDINGYTELADQCITAEDVDRLYHSFSNEQPEAVA